MLSFIILSYTLLSPLFMKAKVFNSKNNYTIKSMLQDIIKYHLNTIMIIFTLGVSSAAFNNLGNINGLLSLVAFICIYFFTAVFKSYNTDNDINISNGILSFNQFVKECS